MHEARIYLGHLLYDRGEWRRALEQFEAVPVEEHFDTLAIWRVLELKRAIHGEALGSTKLAPWEGRLEQIEAESDPIDALLAEIEGGSLDEDEDEDERVAHRVQTPEGHVFVGSWRDILRQMRDLRGDGGETIAQFMRSEAEKERARTGIRIPADDPEAFLRASARAGLLRIEC